MIELRGAHAGNKGAELMTKTVIDRLRAFDEGLRFAASPRGSYESRARYGLWQVYPRRRTGHPPFVGLRLTVDALSGRFVRRRTAERYGLARHGDIDALVDLSGSSFSDFWPVDDIRTFAALARRLRRRGRPVVLLPQMFGPFEKPGAAKAMTAVLQHVTLAYARDRESLRYLHELVGEDPRLRLAPDITIAPEGEEGDSALAYLVPNVRMLDKGEADWQQVYMARLAAVGRRLMERGLDVRVMIHDVRPDDLTLGRDLLRAMGRTEAPLEAVEQPLAAKARLGRARLVVASRYHSIVGALSMGTPAIVMGWSHKYGELLCDFGVEGLLHRATDSEADLLALADRLAEPASRAAYEDQLVRAKAAMLEPIDRMWRDVAAALGLRHQAPSQERST
jgi:colanic acid/amylovoran biosynthesis protein